MERREVGKGERGQGHRWGEIVEGRVMVGEEEEALPWGSGGSGWGVG